MCLDEICTDSIDPVPYSHSLHLRLQVSENKLDAKLSNRVAYPERLSNNERLKLNRTWNRNTLRSLRDTIDNIRDARTQDVGRGIDARTGFSPRAKDTWNSDGKMTSRIFKHVMSHPISQEDVLVFLHIQKTGGTSFGKHLVQNLDLAHPCQCSKEKIRCECFTGHSHIWLFSRFSTGWACGLHADWTELTTCVDHLLNKKEIHQRATAYRYPQQSLF